MVFSFLQSPGFAAEKSYVVYLGGHSHGLEPSSVDLEAVTETHYDCSDSWEGLEHFSVLSYLWDDAREAIFYSYTRHINGFAANLDDEVAFQIARHPDVVSVFMNKGRKLHTTRSWEFLGMEQDGVVPSNLIWHKARYGEDTIIGNLDTGVWPESKSFSDDGYGPIPSKWKGVCQNDKDPSFQCNRKLIGGRYFNKGYAAVVGAKLNSSFDTPRDNDGHGTHTLSTAGGNLVAKASVFGFGKGTAKGGSPRARVAAYKVCWPPVGGEECFDADILAAFDMAIHDGVDVVSVSLGGDPVDFFNDSTTIGSFHAIKHGIVVVCSGGNSGPADGTVSNIAPWQITVGASTMGREFPSYVVLGNNMRYKGQSLSDKVLPHQKLVPLVSAADAKVANSSVETAQELSIPKRQPERFWYVFEGRMRVDKSKQAALAGAVGMILANDILSDNEIIADAHVLPASHINYTDVTVWISGIGIPQLILHRPSMSSPHVSGIVGLLKTLYPNWSPAAIKSAIMTTATTLDNLNEPILNASNIEAGPFSYGAGHVQPNLAMDPGLVYDLATTDYLTS
ncbi:Subtilisin-like protease SBT5.3 [Hibiscus syriacus]|uniref:Subtilisin-like protease SBT5.3 n=1 Tax=Hibiscus syriacus TaxID=106335 RepID=A0A6A2WCN8_HIBSY|nr:Subtilisin-like protease SBT5.3 [Hibiscus syriacus]